jgi:hypothetical protein
MSVTKAAKRAEIEALEKSLHDVTFAWESLRAAHSKAGRVAQIELLKLTGEQADLMNRTKHLLECVSADAEG